jgi:hypothetical protein
MAAPSLTYTLSNGTTADASQVMQNFNDLLNGITDGTKDLSINAITCAGTATFNGNTNIGNATGDDLSITASLASTIPVKTNTSFDIGSSTKGLANLYMGASSTFTAKFTAATHAASRTYTIPDAGTNANFLLSELAQSKNGILTFNDGIKVASGGDTFSRFSDVASVSYNSADYTADTGTWTVDSGDLLEFHCFGIGNMALVVFTIETSSISSGSATELYIALPTGFQPTTGVRCFTPIDLTVNAGTTDVGRARVISGANRIVVYRRDAAAFGASTNTTNVRGMIMFKRA